MHNTRAVGYMLLFVAIFSLVPLMIDVGGGTENPFLMNGAWRVGGVLGGLAFLVARFRAMLFDHRNLAIIIRRSFGWMMLFAAFGKLEFVWYGLSTRFIDISAAAILYEIWPILMVFVMAWMFRNEGRYRRVTLGTVLLLFLCFLGYVFVILSQVEDFRGLDTGRGLELLFGVGLVVLAAVVGGTHNAVVFRWGIGLREQLFSVGNDDKDNSVELFGIVTGQVISQLFCLFPSFALGFAFGESLSGRTLMLVLAAGILVSGFSDVLFRKANSITDNLGINAIAYSTPVVGLVWLVVFGRVGDVSFDLLVIGGTALITANLLINFEAELRFGFKTLIIALWSCGTFVYVRDDVLILLPSDSWLWTGVPYIQLMTLSATVFILLLSFRVVRLVSRTRDEDNRAFNLFQNVDLLVRRNLIDGAVREHVLAIDGSRSPEQLAVAYREAKLCLVRAMESCPDPGDQIRIAEAEAQLNSLTYSRQQGIDFGELFALMTFGAITVVLALASRVDVSGWTAVLFELFTTLFSAVIIFLMSNVWDLQRDRTNRILQKLPDHGGYSVVFRDYQNRGFEQVTSIVVGVGVTATYVGLFCYKWLG